MGRRKPIALRYGGVLSPREEEDSESEDSLGQGVESASEDREVLKHEGRVPVLKEDLVCCLGIWSNVKMSVLESAMDSRSELMSQGEEFVVTFGVPAGVKSKCEFAVLDNFEGGVRVLARGRVGWSSFKPRAPCSRARKAVELLQEGGFLAFTCEVLGEKRGTGKARESILNTSIRIYLSRLSLDAKLLSRKREGRSSLRTVFSWLNEELRFPALEGPGAGLRGGRGSRRRDSRQTVQIRPDELYAVLQDYEVSWKRMGSNQRDQAEDWRMMGLTSELRSYQKDAVLFAFRVEKEGVRVHLEYPPYWFCLKVPGTGRGGEEENSLYVNMISGEVSLNAPPSGGGTFLIRGGFLCDEMGLGKSLEIIALILMNPRAESRHQALEKPRRREERPSPSVPKGSESGPVEVECPCGVSGPTPGLNVVGCSKCGVRFHYECCIGDWDEAGAETELLCSLCQSTELSERLEVKATLIVAPGSIVDQWLDEFSKHLEAGRLRVVKYQGVRHIQSHLRSLSQGSRRSRTRGEGTMIRTRRDILKYDVVLTSYETLKEEIYHVLDHEDASGKRSLRYRKTYPILASLLTNIDWWRIVLDEAQMTEGYSLVSKMTRKLSCHNKWCVSGTPIVRSCSNDLIGLLLNLSNVGFHLIHDSLYKRYLGYLSTILYIKPKKDIPESSESGSTTSDLERGNGDHESESGLECITSQYKSMRNLMAHLERLVGPLFYRREMSQVKEEINIPPVFYGNTYLGLSSIERFFYVKQCEAGYNSVLGYPDLETFSRNKKELDSLITMLRLACIHPQLGTMGIHNRSNIRDSSSHLDAEHSKDSSIVSLNTGLRIMTMDQILDKLLNKCRIHIEESVRKYVMNTLGLAGIYFSSGQEKSEQGGGSRPSRSVFYYRQVLDIRREDRVDVLQQIHALWNLGEICDDESERKSLLEECRELEAKYRSKYYKEFLERHESFAASRDKASSLFSEEEDRWWHVFKRLAKAREPGAGTGEECAFLDRVESFQYEFRSARDGDSEHLLPSFCSVSGLVAALDLRVQRMQESREELLHQLGRLELLRLGQQQGQSQEESQDARSQLALDEIIAKISFCPACQEKDQGPQAEEEEEKESLRKSRGGRNRARDHRQPQRDLCTLCEIQTHIEKMEYSLYTIKRRNFSRHSESSSAASRGVEEDKPLPEQHHDSTCLRDSEAVATLKFLSRELRRAFKLGPGAEEGQDLHSFSQISAKHIRYIESLKLELSNAKAFVSATRQLVNSYLELIDCKQRMQVIRDDQSELSSNHNSFRRSEIPLLTEKYESERISALSTRRNLKSQQKFLCNLKLQQSSKKTPKEEEQEQDEMCPICLNRLKEDYSQVLLPCAHILCIDCYTLITSKKHLGSSKVKGFCPKCRSAFQDTNVVLIVPDNHKNATDPQAEDHDSESGNALYASSTSKAPSKTNHVDFGLDFNEIHSQPIIGNFGTKIEAIIKHIKWILNNPSPKNVNTSTEDLSNGISTEMRANNDKMIIFSDFQSVIDILSSALHLNEIKFKKYAGGKSEYHIIREFSSSNNSEHASEENYKVLLCNHLNVGKGVNITAANHILFVSPLLNKSDELQAIGRIVRMGQTKTPHIWNFIINDSVDELIFQYLSNFYSANKLQDGRPSSNSSNQHSLNLKIIQHVSDTNYSNFRQNDKQTSCSSSSLQS